MSISTYEALLVILFGVIGLISSIRLEQEMTASALSIGMVMNPAKWTGLLSLILLACGTIALVRHFRKRTVTNADTGDTPGFKIISVRGIKLIGLLVGWIAAMHVMGFNVANVLFFPLLFTICGVRSWPKSIVIGISATVAFYLIFTVGLKVPMPKGWFGY